MNQQEIRTYVESFFTLRDCKILESTPSYITVELNPETDKDLSYRPFYWSYVEKMRQTPQLLIKRYIFDPTFPHSEMGDEYLLFGSSRLRQIFLVAKKRGQYIRLYEEHNTTFRTEALSPWVMINYKVEYVCDKKKEKLLSYGFNLITGEIYEQFYQFIQKLSLTPKLPAYLFIQSPIYSTYLAIQQIEQNITRELQSEDDSWVKNSISKLEYEKQQTLQYYQELLENYKKKKSTTVEAQDENQWEIEKNKRIEELEWQYSPRVDISPINIGIFYLLSHPNKILSKHL